MKRFLRFSTAVSLIALPALLVACGGGDPGPGSSGPPSAGPSSVSTTPSADDAGSGDAGPTLLTRPSDASLTVDTAPPFQNPAAGDGACAAPNLVCGGDGGSEAGPACVDVSNDSLNCGGCGKQCMGPSATCIARACACQQLGFLYCTAAGGCIDVTGDVNNCGACGLVCDPNQFNACSSGICVSQ